MAVFLRIQRLDYSSTRTLALAASTAVKACTHSLTPSHVTTLLHT